MATEESHQVALVVLRQECAHVQEKITKEKLALATATTSRDAAQRNMDFYQGQIDAAEEKLADLRKAMLFLEGEGLSTKGELLSDLSDLAAQS